MSLLLMLAALDPCLMATQFERSEPNEIWDMKIPDAGEREIRCKLKLRPAFYVDGDDIGTLERSDLQSEGEYSFEQSFRFGLGDGTEVGVLPKVTASPHWFDTEDGSAAASVELRLARSIPRSWTGNRPFDTVQTFVAYEPGWAWDGVFDDYKATDQKISGGFTYTDYWKWNCKTGERATIEGRRGNCSGDEGLRVIVTGRWSRLESDLPSREYEGPLVEARLAAPVWRSSQASLAVTYEHRDYTGRAPLAGAEVFADRYVVEAAFDISGYAERVFRLPKDDYTVEIGVRWVTVDSNAADLERNRLSIIPTLTRKW